MTPLVVLGTLTACRSSLALLSCPVVLSSLQNLDEKFELTEVAQDGVGVSCKVAEGSRAALERRSSPISGQGSSTSEARLEKSRELTKSVLQKGGCGRRHGRFQSICGRQSQRF